MHLVGLEAGADVRAAHTLYVVAYQVVAVELNQLLAVTKLLPHSDSGLRGTAGLQVV